jgi:chromosome segregation ATPase
MEAVAPFGITDPAQAATMVRERVEQARAARLQDGLEQVERREAELAAEVEEHLAGLGFADGLIDTRISSFERALARAGEREQARQRARTPAEIEAELAGVQSQVEEAYRPQYATLSPADAEDEPDIEGLRDQHAALAERLRAARAALPDIDRLADRHSALERRVAALEAKHASFGGGPGPGALADVQQFLLSHLTSVSRCGPAGEAVPVVFNEAFARVPGEKRLELLALLERLADRVQVIYLTDDAPSAAWARKRVEERAVGLLEPIGATL